MQKPDSNTDGSGKNQPKDIVVRTFDFALAVIQLCVKLDERPGVGRVLMSQILRAGTSVPANVVPTNDLNPLIQEADEIRRVIGAVIVSTNRGGAS